MTDLAAPESAFVSHLEQTGEFFGLETERHAGILYVTFWWAEMQMTTLIAVVPSLNEDNYAEQRTAILEYAEQRKQKDCAKHPDIEGYYWHIGMACLKSRLQPHMLKRYKADKAFNVQFALLTENGVY